MKTGNLSLALVILALVAGLSLGAVAGNLLADEEVKEVEAEVPTEVEVEKLVEKDFQAYLDEAVDEYLADVKEDLDKYQEVSVVEVGENWTIDFSEDLNETAFNIEYKIFDNLEDTRESESCNVSIIKESEEEEVIEAVC